MKTKWSNYFFNAAAIAAVMFGTNQIASADAFNFVLFQYPGTHISAGLGINNSGQVVGYAVEAPGFTADPIGFLYDSGSFTPILAPGTTSTYAKDINNLRVVLGLSSTGAFLESGGVYTPFSSPANGINDLGQIVGVGNAGGFFYDGSFHTVLGTPNGVNNSGQIVGDYTVGTKTVGYIDNGGVYTTIDVPGSSSTNANGINDLGIVVGDYADVLGSHGFVYYNGVLTKFDAPGANPLPDGPSTYATGINDYGEISGFQAYSGGSTFAFIATPVPEPGTLGLFGTGTVVLAGGMRRRWLH